MATVATKAYVISHSRSIAPDTHYVMRNASSL